MVSYWKDLAGRIKKYLVKQARANGKDALWFMGIAALAIGEAVVVSRAADYLFPSPQGLSVIVTVFGCIVLFVAEMFLGLDYAKWKSNRKYAQRSEEP